MPGAGARAGGSEGALKLGPAQLDGIEIEAGEPRSGPIEGAIEWLLSLARDAIPERSAKEKLVSALRDRLSQFVGRPLNAETKGAVEQEISAFERDLQRLADPRE